MACQIINPIHASLNGSPGAYNGVITSVSLNIGGLASGGIRATVSLVKDPELPPDVPLLRPKPGDNFVLNAAGMHMKLDVGSYNFSNQAGSTNTLTLSERMYIPISIVGDNFDNKIEVNVESFEFEGNLKNFYASLKSGAKIKFSVPNAIDTSSISSGSTIELGFESSKSVILPKAPLAID